MATSGSRARLDALETDASARAQLVDLAGDERVVARVRALSKSDHGCGRLADLLTSGALEREMRCELAGERVVAAASAEQTAVRAAAELHTRRALATLKQSTASRAS